MLKTLVRRSGLAAATLAAVLLSTLDSGSSPAQSDRQQVAAATLAGGRLGIYDPAGAFGSTAALSIEHIYLPLFGVDLESLRSAGNYAAVRNRDLLVTVEPWSWDGRWNLANEEAIAEIVSGKHDERIVSLCSAIGALPTPVLIRWGHEMEARTRRYAWTMLPPADYIAGYRHFVALCRQYAPAAQFMWSPLGEPELVNFYPGDDVVDVIGLSVFALQQYERDITGEDRNVGEIARLRVDRVLGYRKPVYIAELGCSGDADYVAKCLQQYRTLIGGLPGLVGIVYFNDVEPATWPAGYGRPDWRLPPTAFADP